LIGETHRVSVDASSYILFYYVESMTSTTTLHLCSNVHVIGVSDFQSLHFDIGLHNFSACISAVDFSWIVLCIVLSNSV